MRVELKPFIALMKRAVKSKYKSVYIINRMIMQCYSIDIDSDVGLHYVLPIPDLPEYDSELYNMLLKLYPADIVKTYTDGFKECDTERKNRKLKPRDMVEELFIQENDSNEVEFKFIYYLSDQVYTTRTISHIQVMNEYDSEIVNCTQTLDNIYHRLKAGGFGILLDGLRSGIMLRAYESNTIHFHVITVDQKKIRIPFMKSMFLGSVKWDSVLITIQETNIDNIYIFALQLTRDNLSEIFFGYIQNF